MKNKNQKHKKLYGEKFFLNSIMFSLAILFILTLFVFESKNVLGLDQNSNAVNSSFCQSHFYFSSSMPIMGQGCCFNMQYFNSNSIINNSPNLPDGSTDNRFLCFNGQIFSHIHYANDSSKSDLYPNQGWWAINTPSCSVKGNYYAYPNYPWSSAQQEWAGGWKSGNGLNVSCANGKICDGNGNCVQQLQSIICSDSDNGQNIFVQGTTSVTGQPPYVDSCVSNSNTVDEGYCSGNAMGRIQISCPSGYSCSNGACVSQQPNQTIICTSNSQCDDNNRLTFDQCINPGTVASFCRYTQINCANDLDCGASGFVGNNYCSNNNVVENFQNSTCVNAGTTQSYCSTIVISEVINYCQSSCNSGVCQNLQNTTCIDSDGGKNYSTYGYVSAGGINYPDVCDPANSSYLWENFCSNNIAQSQKVFCQYGCTNGACNSQPSNNQTNQTTSLNITLTIPNDASCLWPPINNLSEIRNMTSGYLGWAYNNQLSNITFLGDNSTKVPGNYIDERLLCYNNQWHAAINKWQYFNPVMGHVLGDKMGTWVVVSDNFWERKWTQNSSLNSTSTNLSLIDQGNSADNTNYKRSCYTVDGQIYSGDRTDSRYCENGKLKSQKGDGLSCSDDYQCSSNLCVGGVCSSNSMIRENLVVNYNNTSDNSGSIYLPQNIQYQDYKVNKTKVGNVNSLTGNNFLWWVLIALAVVSIVILIIIIVVAMS